MANKRSAIWLYVVCHQMNNIIYYTKKIRVHTLYGLVLYNDVTSIDTFQ